jgi:catechol 2,3-dioxygenase-like lactoylglutathione lyase family enzyme
MTETTGERPDPIAFGRAIRPGLGVNLLVRSIEVATRFQRDALGARAVYRERGFAIMSGVGSTWLLHADETYGRHPLGLAVEGLQVRGSGVELRLYGTDPDAAAARAEAAGGHVLVEPIDKPHGLREAYLLDPDGYVWVPCVPTGDD